MQGLCGIMSSKAIYASDFRFLNDREEVLHACKIAQRLVLEHPEQGSNGLELRKAVGFLVDDIFSIEGGMFNPGSLQGFVSSFSAKADSLSQWRAYSKGSSGASLGFSVARATQPPPKIDKEWFNAKLNKGFPPIFAPCVYDVRKKEQLLRYSLNHMVAAFQEIWNEFPRVRSIIMSWPANKRFVNQAFAAVTGLSDLSNAQTQKVLAVADAVTQTLGELLFVTALLKNESFAEEEEWRLVLWSNVADVSSRLTPHFRVGSNTLIPYVSYSIADDAPIPITLSDLILGPESDETAVSSAHQFLGTFGIDIDPSFSSIPYRTR
jgi:hypothetical protein